MGRARHCGGCQCNERRREVSLRATPFYQGPGGPTPPYRFLLEDDYDDIGGPYPRRRMRLDE